MEAAGRVRAHNDPRERRPQLGGRAGDSPGGVRVLMEARRREVRNGCAEMLQKVHVRARKYAKVK